MRGDLHWLYRKQSDAVKLRVRNGSRAVFDAAAKLTGLLHFANEIDDLVKEILKA
jgi:hypothetical protein